MKKYIILLIFGVSIPVYASETADSKQWNYIELSHVKVETDYAGDGDGFGLDAKYSLNKNLYLSGVYQSYSFAGADHDRYMFGLGGRHEINKQLAAFLQIDHVTVESSSRFGATPSIKYWILGAGISGSSDRVGYKLALLHYEAISDTLSNDSGYYAEVYYSIDKKMSLGVELESTGDSGDIYSYAFRYHY